jgi:murein DD-endopeptidase MepM/ murein hydrolase activator NlpD
MKIFDYLRNTKYIKKKLFKIAGTVSVVVILCMVGMISSNHFNLIKIEGNNDIPNQAYEISFNNVSLGMVENVEDIGILMTKAYDQLSLELGYAPEINQLVTTKRVDCTVGDIKAVELLSVQLKNGYLASIDTMKIKSYRIMIDEKTAVYLETKEEAEQVLRAVQLMTIGEDQIVDIYLEETQDNSTELSITSELVFLNVDNSPNFITAAPGAFIQSATESSLAYDDLVTYQTEEDSAELLDVGFVEMVSVEEQYVNESDISNVASAIISLTQKNDHLYIYTLPSGYELITKVSVPDLSVYVKETLTYSKNIPMKTSYVENPDKYEGTDSIIDKGNDGRSDITVEITVVNGSVTDSQITNEEITKEAEDKVISKGTKPLPIPGLIGAFASPLAEYRLTSTFGLRWNRQHKGIDMAIASGAQVMAAYDGTVSYAGWKGDYGYLVAIDHGNGVFTKYAHNRKLLVEVGQTVSKYDIIAESGNTGHSTGPHVHFEIIFDKINVNPLDYMKQ